MAASMTFGNRLVLVLLPVCAFSNHVIKSKKMKASVLSLDGIIQSNIHLTVKDSGYLVFGTVRPLEIKEVRILLEVPGYLPGSCVLPLTGPEEPLKEHRVNLYPTRSIFLGEKYTAIYGKAPLGTRILAFSGEDEDELRLMADVSRGDEKISLYSSGDNLEGRTIAALDDKGKPAAFLEAEEMIDFPYGYRMKGPAAVSLKRFTARLYPVAVTEAARTEKTASVSREKVSCTEGEGEYFLPLPMKAKEARKYFLVLTKQTGNEIIETEIIPGKENRADLG